MPGRSDRCYAAFFVAKAMPGLSMTPMTSDSFMIGRSSPSSLLSEPGQLSNRTRSPCLTSSGVSSTPYWPPNCEVSASIQQLATTEIVDCEHDALEMAPPNGGRDVDGLDASPGRQLSQSPPGPAPSSASARPGAPTPPPLRRPRCPDQR